VHAAARYPDRHVEHARSALRLLLAAALGGVIGFERERHTWAAGLRTHMLVCLGAALAMRGSLGDLADALRALPGVTTVTLEVTPPGGWVQPSTLR